MTKETLDFWSTQTQQLLKNLPEKMFLGLGQPVESRVGWVGYRQQRGAACQTEDSPPLQYKSRMCKLCSGIFINHFWPKHFFTKNYVIIWHLLATPPPYLIFLYKMYLRPLSKGVKDKEAFPPPVFDKFPCWSTFESRKLLSSYKLLIQRKLST